MPLDAGPDAQSADTPREVRDIQVRHWRAMSAHQKGTLVSALSLTTHSLAEAGVRARYPHAFSRERFLRLALVRLGRDLAVAAYPDAASLTPWRRTRSPSRGSSPASSIASTCAIPSEVRSPAADPPTPTR